MTTIESDPRWQALQNRDQDGSFVYAVKTTGVYCRPDCAARLPRPGNVEFFDTGGQAAEAGYRPCKRCRPEQPARREQQRELVERICRRLEQSEEIPALAELAAEAGLSPHHFHRLFKASTGVTPRAYATARRAQRLHRQLAEAGSVTEAIFESGYNSSGRFYAEADALLGMTPSQFRAGGEDALIRFAVAQCSLGPLLVARSQRGLCAIWLGDDPDRLVRDLQDRFPRAQLVGADSEFEALVAQVVGLLERPDQSLELPLDVRGTAFQRRVWEALRQIPAGTTVSYADLARRLGSPGSVRAVAGACAANQLAVAIPCHRVVRSDGNLSGYRWGVDRKQALLRREGSWR